MNCFGYFETTGGPVLVANAEDAEHWNGIDGDYYELIKYSPADLVYCFAKNGRTFLVFNTEVGNFVIFYDVDVIVLCEILYITGEEVLPFPRFEDFRILEGNIIQFTS